MFEFFPRIFKIALLALVAAVFAFSAQPAKAAPAPYFGPMPGMVVLGQSALGFNLFEDRTNSFADEKAEAKQNLQNLGCVTCEIFDTFADATFQGMASIDGQASGLIPVVATVAMVFSLFYLGSALVAGDAGDLLGRWQVFWRLMMTVAAASIVLSAPIRIVWQLIYEPLFLIGQAVIDSVGAGALPASCSASSPGVYPEAANSALTSMSGTVCGAYNLVLDGLATGIAMFYATPDDFGGILIFVIAGAFICLIYGWLAIVFPLRFIDVVIRLALVSIITPFLVLAAAFKPTRGYATIGVSNVLNATAQFALLTVIFKIGSGVLDEFGQGIANVGDASYGQMIITTLSMVGVAMVFSGLVKAVPSIAAEFSRSSGSGGGEGGSAATRAVAAPAMIAATAAGGAGAITGRMAAAKGAAALRTAGGAARRGLGKGTS